MTKQQKLEGMIDIVANFVWTIGHTSPDTRFEAKQAEEGLYHLGSLLGINKKNIYERTPELYLKEYERVS